VVLHQFEQGVVKIGRYPLIFRSEYCKRRRAQLGFDTGMAGKSLDEGANFLTLSSRRRREFNSHAETGVWNGLLAPASTPRPVIDRLAQAAAEVVRSEDFIKALDANGILPFGSSTPDELGQFIRNEIEKWGKVVVASGMQNR